MMIGLSRVNGQTALVFAALGLAACGGATSSAPPVAAPQAPVALVQRASKSQACETKPCIYVTNGDAPSVTEYSDDANGDVRPIQSISGLATGLDGPSGVAVDATGKIYVTNINGSYVLLVFAAGSHGNVEPISRIQSEPSDHINGPGGLSLDADGNSYIPGVKSDSVSVYAAGASGAAAPIQFIEGSNTNLHYPRSIAVSKNHTIYVCNFYGNGTQPDSSITVYAPGASGNVAPIRTISGDKTNLDGCTGVAVDSTGKIYTSNLDSGSSGPPGINVFAKRAKGNVRPIATIAGSMTGIEGANGLALDSGDNIYVNDYPTTSVYEFAKGAKGNVPPLRTITGRRTKLDLPDSLTVH